MYSSLWYLTIGLLVNNKRWGKGRGAKEKEADMPLYKSKSQRQKKRQLSPGQKDYYGEQSFGRIFVREGDL